MKQTHGVGAEEEVAMKAWENDSHTSAKYATLCILSAASWILAAAICGCDSDSPTKVHRTPVGPPPPVDLVQVSFAGESLTFWPYAGSTLDEPGSDPINLIFVGRASPVEIRAALLALDGDRSALGLPPVDPFTSTWSDANGDVQATYAQDGGWVGAVVQLQLGSYGPMRVHLRLFGTSAGFGDGGTWTLGSAHFELVIPGTADHQVLSWELAEQLVAGDLARSGLLDATTPSGAASGINAAPGYREIPPFIFNELPPELRMLTLLPIERVTEPVPIPSDGSATILNLLDAAAITPGTFTDAFSMEYDIVMPKPFCNEQGSEWVHVGGPVEFFKTVTVTADGNYHCESGYSGKLVVKPMDVAANPPASTGESYSADVSDTQVGEITGGQWEVSSTVERISSPAGGAEHLLMELRLASDGEREATSAADCLGPGRGPLPAEVHER
jgi:hypothetical protein